MGVVDVDRTYVTIYPNPTAALLNIESEVPVKQLQLISFEGKIVKNSLHQNKSTSAIFQKEFMY